jgi:hypothetical protein
MESQVPPPVVAPISLKGSLKNKYSLLVVCCLLSFVLLPVLIANCVHLPGSVNRIFPETVIRTLLLLFCLSAVISSWSILLIVTCFKRNSPIQSESTAASLVAVDYRSSRTYRLIQFLQTVMILSMSCYFTFLLVFRSSSSTRQCRTQLGMADWSCNPYKEVPVFPMDTAFILFLIPSSFAVINKEKHFRLTAISWLLAVSSLVISAILLRSIHSIVIIVFYCFLSFVVMGDSFKNHLLIVQLYDSLKISLQEKQALLDLQKLNQMKDVIGNVSHDLKTVRKQLLFQIYLFR